VEVVAISLIIIFTIIINSSVFIYFFGEFNFRTVVTKKFGILGMLFGENSKKIA